MRTRAGLDLWATGGVGGSNLISASSLMEAAADSLLSPGHGHDSTATSAAATAAAMSAADGLGDQGQSHPSSSFLYCSPFLIHLLLFLSDPAQLYSLHAASSN